MVGEVEAPDALALHLLGVDDHLEQAEPLSLFAHNHNSSSFKKGQSLQIRFRENYIFGFTEDMRRVTIKIFKDLPELLIVL